MFELVGLSCECAHILFGLVLGIVISKIFNGLYSKGYWFGGNAVEGDSIRARANKRESVGKDVPKALNKGQTASDGAAHVSAVAEEGENQLFGLSKRLEGVYADYAGCPPYPDQLIDFLAQVCPHFSLCMDTETPYS